MKTTLKNTAPAIVFFLIMFAIAFLSTNASAQTTTDSTIAFRYDGFQDVNDAPASISKERLEDYEIERKMYYYEMVLPNGHIGLPNMEDIKNHLMEEVMEAIKIHFSTPLVHLIKEEDNNKSTANLINPEWDGCWNEWYANLINPDWDGAHRG